MISRNSTRSNRILLSLLVLCGFLLAHLLIAAAYGAEAGENGKPETFRSENVVIMGKTPKKIFTKENGYYRVAREMEVRDVNGSRIPFESLMVPCDATVFYTREHGRDAMLIRVKVNGVKFNASADWSIFPQ